MMNTIVTGKGGNAEINTKQELNREPLDLKIQHSNERAKVYSGPYMQNELCQHAA